VVNFAFVEEAWEADFAAKTGVRPDPPGESDRQPDGGDALVAVWWPGRPIWSPISSASRSRVRLFEVGRSFHRDAARSRSRASSQPWKLAGLAFGGALPEGWGSGSRKVDFYDVKGDLSRHCWRRRNAAFRETGPSGPASRALCPRIARMEG
jgi:phenylalanyl-tRNA synthetase beta chain